MKINRMSTKTRARREFGSHLGGIDEESTAEVYARPAYVFVALYDGSGSLLMTSMQARELAALLLKAADEVLQRRGKGA